MNKIAFIDTNMIDADRYFTRLFGHRTDLERLSKEYKIVIPRVVIDELLAHKEIEFGKHKKVLSNNPLVSRLHFDINKINELSFDSISKEMIDGETISYETCSPMAVEDFMEKYYPLAIAHKPPFDENSDKGLKDALIASSIEKYIQDNDLNASETKLYLFTNDKKLQEYFENSSIIVKNNYHDLDEYDEIPDGSIDNTNNNEEYREDSKNIIDIDDLVSHLIDSHNFAQTHNLISILMLHTEQLSNNHKIALLKASITNYQINYLLQDEDVMDFFIPIFQEFQNILTDSQYRSFVNNAALPYERLDEDGNVVFSNSERQAYESFIEPFIDSIATRDYNASINLNSDSILIEIRKLLALISLDSTLLTWDALHAIFIEGEVTDSSIRYAPREQDLHDFGQLLEKSNPKKRDAIIQLLSDRFDLIIVEFPF